MEGSIGVSGQDTPRQEHDQGWATTMADKAWKRAERYVANLFNTTRTGPTGRDDADIQLDDLAVEVKYMGRLALRTDHIKQAKENARGRPWLLAIVEAKSGRKVAVCDLAYFAMVYNEWNRLKELYENE